MFKKLFAIMILTIVLFCGCGKKQDDTVVSKLSEIMSKDKIVVGIKTDAYPFGYIDKKGHYAGYDVTLGRVIAKGLLGDEKKVKFVPVTASDRMMKLYSDEVDMLIATYKNIVENLNKYCKKK